MADPIARWRNPSFKTLRELVQVLPKTTLSESDFKKHVNDNWDGDFFRTPYQLACQLGLYYVDDKNTYHPKFQKEPSVFELKTYLTNWIYHYYAPNPYTTSIPPGEESKIIHNAFCNELFTAKTELNLNDVIKDTLPYATGNLDIVNNSINFSLLIEIIKNKLKLKDGVQYSDLTNFTDYEIKFDRKDRKAFFEYFPVDNGKSSRPTATISSGFLQKIYFGAPGTGKSYRVKEITSGFEETTERVTFHPDFDYNAFVGGYRPTMEPSTTSADEVIKYKFEPQAFTNIYTRAWNALQAETKDHFFLIIEEINRGNCSEIFGDIFQLLDRDPDYDITPSKELKKYLVSEGLKDISFGLNKDKLSLPPNLSIVATMNTSDQSLFPMDSAFKRRWDWEYIPINYEDTYLSNDGSIKSNKSAEYKVYFSDGSYFSWTDFIKEVNEKKISPNANLGMDKCLGNYFIKSSDGKIDSDTFINKALFYLYNDVFKDEDSDDSIFDEGITYESFFPVKLKGEVLLKDIVESKLGLEINNK